MMRRELSTRQNTTLQPQYPVKIRKRTKKGEQNEYNEEDEDDKEKKKTAKTDNPDSDDKLNGGFGIAEFDDKSYYDEEYHIPRSKLLPIKTIMNKKNKP